MTIQVDDFSFSVEKTMENEAGEIEVLDEKVLRWASGVVFHEVVKAFLVEWEGEWSLVVWWDAPKLEWELFSNQSVFPVVLS